MSSRPARSGKGTDHVPMSGLEQRKAGARRKIAAILPDVPQWQLHDLRRTARSLMSRAAS